MASVAIITARGGSKRIPKKNIREFCGKPIIAYSIEAAISCGVFDNVMVSTDSEEIAKIARDYGADVPFMRSEQTSNDFAVTADVIMEVINQYDVLGKHYDTVACIYPTAPFVTAKRLSEAMRKMNETSADAVVAVVQYSFPPQRAFVIRDDRVCYQYPEFERTRSQDLEKIYHDCGQFYFVKREAFITHHSLMVPNTVPYFMPEDEVQDIDTMSDWEIAEAKYRVLHKT